MGDHIKPTSTIIFYIPNPEKYFNSIKSLYWLNGLWISIYVMGSSKPGYKTKGASCQTQV